MLPPTLLERMSLDLSESSHSAEGFTQSCLVSSVGVVGMLCLIGVTGWIEWVLDTSLRSTMLLMELVFLFGCGCFLAYQYRQVIQMATPPSSPVTAASPRKRSRSFEVAVDVLALAALLAQIVLGYVLFWLWSRRLVQIYVDETAAAGGGGDFAGFLACLVLLMCTGIAVAGVLSTDGDAALTRMYLANREFLLWPWNSN